MKRFFYRILAIFFIILGIIGAFLPVMPTVPFLLAALYFAADEPGIKNFINSNRLLKKYLDFYQGKGSVPLYEKVAVLSALWISLGFSCYILNNRMLWNVLLAATGIIISIHILHNKR